MKAHQMEDVEIRNSEILTGNDVPNLVSALGQDDSSPPAKDPPKPGIFGKLFFTWMDDIIRLGHQRNKKAENLEASDLLTLQKQFQAEHIMQEVEMLWEEERQRPKPSLAHVLWRKTRGLLLLSAFFELFRLIGSFSSPLLVKQIIIYIQKDEKDLKTGFGLTILMVVGTSLVALGKSHAFHKALAAGLVVKASCNSLVYSKCLRLSNAARQERSTGEIVNLMSTDAERMFQSFLSFNAAWSAPVQLVLALYLIYVEVKDATWIALGGLFFVFFALAVIFMKIMKLEGLRMKAADARVKLLNEMIQGMKVIKLMAWEDPMLLECDKRREVELKHVRELAITKAMMIATVMGSTVIAAMLTFTSYVNFYHVGLDPARIFTASILVNMLRWPLMQIPEAISAYARTKISVGRVQSFIMGEEQEKRKEGGTSMEEGVVISIKNGYFSWGCKKAKEEEEEKGKEKKKNDGKAKKEDKEKEEESKPSEKADEELANVAAQEEQDKPTLEDINLTVRKGELVIVTGKVGCGKSSLLSAILQEISTVSGQVSSSGSIAYASQSCWIQSATVRENVTFKSRLDPERFRLSLRVSALDSDMDVLPAGEETEIGERGINLSGGQKARIQLARAVYSNADIYLLDDPLSAVDTHVARKLMDECILGELKEKTRLLVTHQIQYLSLADRIVVMDGGKIVAQGKLEEVESHIDLSSLHQAHKEEEEAGEGEEEKVGTKEKAEGDAKKGQLTGSEERDKGAVSTEIYMLYFRAWGSKLHLAILVLLFIAVQFLTDGTDFWLTLWSMAVDPTQDPPLSSLKNRHDSFWNGIYAGMAVGSVLLTLVRGVFFQVRGVYASRLLLHRFVQSVLGGSMSFFDTTPSGRIINRFSADTDRIDTQLTSMFENYLTISIWMLGACILICILLPWFCLPFLPIIFIYKMTEAYFTPTARELQRLESVARSPMVSHFSETILGLVTIRAFSRSPLFHARSLFLLDLNLRPQMLGQEARRWLDQRLEMVNILVQFFTAAFCIIARNSISPQYAGLALTKAMSISSILGFLVMMRTMLETGMNAVERIDFYTHNIEQEEAIAAPEPAELSEDWPRTSNIAFEGYSMRYRPGLPLVLNNLSFKINAGEKIGIVGRTGSGKSSMLVALFRLVEGAEGRILIDGADIAAVALKRLRSALAIMPQDPVLFSGSVRFNLDPFSRHTDEELQEVLQCARLGELGLDKEISESGENLSVGQRQLVALARVLLRKPKVLMLDEATASVDVQTDAHVQNTIKTRILAGGTSTMLVIAHRLSTVVDSSRILVMNQGYVQELDTPKNLLSSKSSAFSAMVDKMGAAAAEGLRRQCGASLPA